VVDSHEMAARAGIEPAAAFLQAAIGALSCASQDKGCAQWDAQKCGELAEIVATWAKLPHEIRFSVMALVRAGKGLT
jgi:hypothetical protein